MIITWLLPVSLARPTPKDALTRRLEFLEAVIDDAENGRSIHQSFHTHRYPALSNTHIEKLFQLAFAQGLALLPPLRELVRVTKFLIERDREIEIEIAPARATLNLLTYLPTFILLGAFLTKIIHFDRSFFAPIPIVMILISIVMQVLGRRWSESIINSARS